LALAAIRRNRGISLEQIAASTKIGIRSLEAIERGDFQKLPGGIYTTSYIRQYARAIDYDEEAILAVYKRQIAGSSGGESGSPGRGTKIYRTLRSVWPKLSEAFRGRAH